MNKFFEYDYGYVVDNISDTVIYMGNKSENVKRYATPIPVESSDTTVYVAKKGVVLSERTTLQFNLIGGLHRCFLRVGNILVKNLNACITNN